MVNLTLLSIYVCKITATRTLDKNYIFGMINYF